MDIEERNALIRGFFEERCFSILETKGKASTGGSQDGNKNFKESQLIDEKAGVYIDDIHTWWVFYSKHMVRIKNFILTREEIGEKLIETLADLANYPLILYTILIEKGIIAHPNAKKVSKDIGQ